jgi:hypothetical protein
MSIFEKYLDVVGAVLAVPFIVVGDTADAVRDPEGVRIPTFAVDAAVAVADIPMGIAADVAGVAMSVTGSVVDYFDPPQA